MEEMHRARGVEFLSPLQAPVSLPHHVFTNPEAL